MLGALTTKPTTLVSAGVDVTSICHSCNHPPLRWIIPWSGNGYVSVRPRLRGRQWAIPAHTCHKSMKRTKEPPGPYLTMQASAYPAPMNLQLIARLLWAAALLKHQPKPPKPLADSDTNTPRDQAGRPTVSRNTPLKGPINHEPNHIASVQCVTFVSRYSVYLAIAS